MMSSTLPDIQIEPGALLATAPADTTLEALNEALRPFGLCLPIAPLLPGLALAEAIAQNAGGRRQWRYGTIVRYLRAATLVPHDEINSSLVTRHSPLVVGGSTLKRATGYGLNRALVAGGLPPGYRLAAVTLSLRPLPPARRAMLLACPTLASATAFAAALLPQGLALSALALQTGDGRPQTEASSLHVDMQPVSEPISGLRSPVSSPLDIRLLVELEAIPAVLERQSAQVQALAARHSMQLLEVGDDGRLWKAWEAWAAAPPAGPSLSLTLPRAAIAAVATQAQAIARRYRATLKYSGDLATGRLQLHLVGAYPGEAEQAVAIMSHMAQLQVTSYELQVTSAQSQSSIVNQPALSLSKGQSPIVNLQSLVGERYVLTCPEDIGCYLRDASIAKAEGAPLAVVLPSSTAEVSAVLKLANESNIAVVSRGAGSGLAGGSTPSAGAIVLGLNRLEQMEIDAAQMVAHVGAGVVTADLQRAAEVAGLFYPPDPSSQGASTIGGNIACNAGGPRCLKYGVTADYVLALTVVLADGTVLRMGDGLTGQTDDASTMQLLIGSEGTLAVITEATLRLVPPPAARRTALAIFDRLDDACGTVEQMMAAGLIPAALEIMDNSTIRVVEDYLNIGLPRDAEALLLLMADGEPETVAAEAEQLADLARRGGARSVQVARSAADEANLWKARRSIAPALNRLRPNRLGEDICVPVNRIADCVRRVKAIAEQFGLPIAVFGHAGDGNLHPNILFDSRDAAEVGRVWQAAEAVFQVALDLGGTLSGEHGIGTLKRPFMRAALGDAGLAYQQQLKSRFDPKHILNPGKVLP